LTQTLTGDYCVSFAFISQMQCFMFSTAQNKKIVSMV